MILKAGKVYDHAANGEFGCVRRRGLSFETPQQTELEEAPLKKAELCTNEPLALVAFFRLKS